MHSPWFTSFGQWADCIRKLGIHRVESLQNNRYMEGFAEWAQVWGCSKTMWMPTRGHLCRGGWQNQVDRMICSASCLFSSATLVPSKMSWRLLWSNAWAWQHGILSPVHAWLLFLLSSYSANGVVSWHNSYHSLSRTSKYLVPSSLYDVIPSTGGQ